MKTSASLRNDQITESDEHESSPVVSNKIVSPNQLLELIAHQRFFKGMSESHLRLLAESAMVTEFKDGQWIFRQGDPANR